MKSQVTIKKVPTPKNVRERRSHAFLPHYIPGQYILNYELQHTIPFFILYAVLLVLYVANKQLFIL